MTLRGIFSLVFEFFLLIMALGTDIREFLIVAVCVGCILAYSVLSLIFAEISFKFKSQVSESEVFAGERVAYTFLLKGPVILPVVGKITVKAADNGDITEKSTLRHSFLLFIDFKGEHRYKFEFLCAHTGYWNVGTEKFRVGDIFGMFSFPLVRTRKKNFTVKVTVLPKVQYFEAKNEYFNISRGFGGTAIRNAESGELLGDIRNYKEGDALRRINWKQSVRMKKLFTRQYEMPEMPRVLIAVDSCTAGDSTGSVADIYRAVAVSLASYYLERNNMVNVISLRDPESAEQLDTYLYEKADITLLMYDLLKISFFTGVGGLDIYNFDSTNFVNADIIYILTANPSEGLFSSMNEAEKQGMRIVCIMPQLGEEPLPSVMTAIKNTGIYPIAVRSVDEIDEKVGAGL